MHQPRDYRQTTLRSAVTCSGVGLHSGNVTQMALRPAPAGTGIVFRRTDMPKHKNLIPARHALVADTRLGTTLENKHGARAATVEHLMAALWGMGVDNVIVELDGPEVPIMDGSSEPFVFLIECAGVVALDAPRRILQVLRPVEVRQGGSVARVEPTALDENECTLTVEIDFNHALVARQVSRYDFSQVTFKQSLSRARTFGFEHEIDALRKEGLARGGSLDNAIVVGKDRILNESGLRYSDEFVRHKALDCMGDLYLAGVRIAGHFTFQRPGHGINVALVRTLLADSKAWKLAMREAPVPVYHAPAREQASAYA